MTNLSASLRACSPAFSPSISRHWNTWTRRYTQRQGVSPYPDKHFLALSYLPPDRVQFDNVFWHVFVHIEGVDDRVDLEGHFVLLAPLADFVEAVQVALPALTSAYQLVGIFVETIARDGQYVQIITWWRKLENTKMSLNGISNLKLCIRFSVSPYFLNQFSLIMLPLLTMLTLGSCRSRLQNWTSFPRNSPRSCKKGSPPEKLIFSIPEPKTEVTCLKYHLNT